MKSPRLKWEDCTLRLDGKLFGHICDKDDGDSWLGFRRQENSDNLVGWRSTEAEARQLLESVAYNEISEQRQGAPLPPGVIITGQSITLEQADAPGHLVITIIDEGTGPCARLEAEQWTLNPGEIEMVSALVNEMLAKQEKV
jgi:hypothetical protein